MSKTSSAQDPTGAVVKVIARLRQEAGLTLEDLADRAGMHRTSLGLVERGERGLTISSTAGIARALDLSLSELFALAESDAEGGTSGKVAWTPRRLPATVIREEYHLDQLTRLDAAAVRSAIEYTYDTLDLIDSVLMAKASAPISRLVELANLSSMIGNLLGAGLAKASGGLYARNQPHHFPDLQPQYPGLPGIEVKTALETNSPKGHLPKEGVYLTFRYCLGSPDGGYARGKTNRGSTPWIWEVRAGRLSIDDFSISNTQGDSGKTAVIRTPSLQRMSVVLFDRRFFPYERPWGGLSAHGVMSSTGFDRDSDDTYGRKSLL